MKEQGIGTHKRATRPLAGVILALGLAVGAASEAHAIKVYTAIGDSITAGYGISSTSKRYTNRLGGMLGQTVYNRGVGGETTSAGLSRIQKVINNTNPTHMFIMFGTNDVNGPSNISGSARNIREMAQICRDNNVIPIVLTIPPFVGPKAAYNAQVVAYNNLVKGAADQYDYFVVDVYSAFGGGSGLFLSDGFHPNDEGQRVIANTVFNSGKATLPALPAKPALISPSGTITGSRYPTFQWQNLSNATWYHLLVKRDGKVFLDQWVQSPATSYTSPEAVACGPYTWWITSKNQSGNGPWSTGMDFLYNDPSRCCFPEKVDGLMHAYGSGDAVDYSWEADPCAGWNHLIVQRDGKNWIDEQYQANPSGGRDGVSIAGHGFAEYTYWVQADSVDGAGSWSDAHTFLYGLAVPELPSGATTDRPPRFSWDDSASSDAAWYQILVKRDGKTYTSWWVSRADTGTSGSFRYCDPPAGTSFQWGDYTWFVQSYKKKGDTMWSSGRAFTITQQTPGASAPVSPNGGVAETRTPTFIWAGVATAEKYHLLLQRDGKTYLDRWFNDLTSWTSDEDMPDGPYSWWVRTWNADGMGPWSAKATVEIPSLKPGVSTPVSPSGVASGNPPILTWSPADRATWYNVYIKKDGKVYWSKWLQGVTTFSPGWTFASGDYRWWIQTYGDYGYGPWSGMVEFTVP